MRGKKPSLNNFKRLLLEVKLMQYIATIQTLNKNKLKDIVILRYLFHKKKHLIYLSKDK